MSSFRQLMMRKKEETLYPVIKGSLTESPEGVFSGFSASNYLETSVLSIAEGTPFDIQIKVTTPNEYLGNWLMAFLTNSSRIYCLTQAPVFRYLSNGTATNLSFNYTMAFNTTYILRINYNGTKLKATIYDGNNNVLSTNEIEDTKVVFFNGSYTIGSNKNNQYFNGSIDLNNSYIKINSTKYKLQAVVGYTVVGSPTITDGVVSGFSNSNYLSLTQLPADTQKFEIVICFESNTTDTPIIATNSLGFIIRQSYNQARVFLASTTSSGWDISNGRYLTAPNNAKNWIKIEFTGTQYILSSSNNGINYTIEHTINNSSSIYGLLNSPIRIGQMYLNNQYYDGLIYINEIYIKINNKLWFNGQQA